MLRSLTIAALSLAACAEANAGCRQVGWTEVKELGAYQTHDDRGFTITRTGARFVVRTKKTKDRVSWLILRPYNDEAELDCRETGPAPRLTCKPVGNPPGFYEIHVINEMDHRIAYQLGCFNR